jgi:hypothetical protein
LLATDETSSKTIIENYQCLSRFSSAVEQRFCKPKVGSSILSTGTSAISSLVGHRTRLARDAKTRAARRRLHRITQLAQPSVPCDHRSAELVVHADPRHVHRQTAGLLPVGEREAAASVPWLAKHYGGVVGHGVDRPASTITCSDHHSLVAASIIKMRGTGTANSAEEPLHTITAGELHYAEVRAFLIKYFGTDQDPKLEDPLHTVTTKDRFGLVTIHGEDYEIADIGMRMLTQRELYRAQGFDDSYIIDKGIGGNPLSKVAQVRVCGNSVSPVLSKAIVEANLAETEMFEAANDNAKASC